MIMLRAVPVILTVAGLLGSNATLAQTSNPPIAQQAPIYPDGPTTDGRPNYGMLGVLTVKAGDDRLNIRGARDAMHRADTAWAHGRKKEACNWAIEAYDYATGSAAVSDAVDEYCAADTKKAADRG